MVRPPALGLKFSIPTWVPVDRLFPEEREEYLRVLGTRKAQPSEEQKPPPEHVSQIERTALDAVPVDSASNDGHEIKANTIESSKSIDTVTASIVKEGEGESSNDEPPLKKLRLDATTPSGTLGSVNEGLLPSTTGGENAVSGSSLETGNAAAVVPQTEMSEPQAPKIQEGVNVVVNKATEGVPAGMEIETSTADAMEESATV